MRPDSLSGDSAERAWLSKGSKRCPAARPSERQRKSRRVTTGGFLDGGASGETALGTVRFARIWLQPVATHHSAVTPAMLKQRATMAAPATVLAPAGGGEHQKAILLRLAQSFVWWARRIGEFLERGRALAHQLGAHVELLDRILRAISAGARGKALRALLGEIT